MSYYQIKSDKLNRKLIDVFKLDKGTLLNFLENVASINLSAITNEVYQKSSDKELILNEICKLVKEDFILTEKEFNTGEFDIQYFFIPYNPIIKISTFSCELKSTNGSAIVYDVVRIGKNENEFYLYLPNEKQ